MADRDTTAAAAARAGRKINWPAWIALLAGILALVYGIVHHSGNSGTGMSPQQSTSGSGATTGTSGSGGQASGSQ